VRKSHFSLGCLFLSFHTLLDKIRRRNSPSCSSHHLLPTLHIITTYHIAAPSDWPRAKSITTQLNCLALSISYIFGTFHVRSATSKSEFRLWTLVIGIRPVSATLIRHTHTNKHTKRNLPLDLSHLSLVSHIIFTHSTPAIHNSATEDLWFSPLIFALGLRLTHLPSCSPSSRNLHPARYIFEMSVSALSTHS
jgi:hypothetical protein